jgi:hypothetical protein
VEKLCPLLIGYDDTWIPREPVLTPHEKSRLSRIQSEESLETIQQKFALYDYFTRTPE